MKKLSLKPNAFSKGEVLTRAQLKKVMGGDASATGSGGDSPCFTTYFLRNEYGCGYTECYGPAATTNPDPNKTDCLCRDIITTPYPCANV